MTKPMSKIALAICFYLTSTCLGIPCRYTVRDIGFVDMHEPRYRLGVVQGASISGDLYEQIAARLKDSNIRMQPLAAEVRTSTEDLTHAALQLSAEGLRSLRLPSAETVEDLVNRLVSSPLQRRLIHGSLGSFAHILLIQGKDETANESARTASKEAMVALKNLETQLPRPIGFPVRFVELSARQQAEEEIMLWSMGLPIGPSAEPAVAIYYGRAKLAGPILRGEEIKKAELLAQLALVGESCECDTSRDWFREPHAPHLWSDEQRQTAWATLGFDPESPVVKAEIGRILERGYFSRSEGQPRSAPEAVETLIFGYKETGLDSKASVRNPKFESSLSQAELPEPVPDLQVIEAGAGDWGFSDEPEEAVPDDAVAEEMKLPVNKKDKPGLLLWLLGGAAVGSLLAAMWVWRARVNS